ncbi:GTPase-activating protein GYP7-like [Oncorhynchus kisutch]|uniref:GTPase-activating protein GYP7-like n=1 Tax=Oncorhynchus kisutch TaxID=8019 RepID=UPI0009A0507F|nr:GTPase-activating protein GYP7-like [Oncorhynchus kisutch]
MDTLQENGLPHSPALDIPGRESTAKELGVCGTPLIKTKGNNGTTERSSPANHVTAEFGNQQLYQVPLVNAPAPSTTPLGLPGVMDVEGRVDDSRLRMHIFKNGGVSPSERGQVWRFLFGMYPCSSTSLERPLLQEQLNIRYHSMKRKWQQLFPAAVRLRINGTDAELVAAVRYYDVRQERVHLQAQNQSDEVRERLSFLELQAQVLFERVTFDLEEFQEAIRIIDKDVPRTDRDLLYYLGEGLGNLLVLRDILITYAAFHPEVSYAQGMNDLCSRFLEVLDSEVDTYWSFSCYMEKFSKDFRADCLHRKIELEAALLKELDPQLHTHLITAWRVSPSVTEDKPVSEAQAVNTEFTFELFICATILLDNRDALLSCRNDVQLIQFTNSLQGTLDLNLTLKKAEEHFYNYCKRSAWDYMNGRCRTSKNKEDHFLFQLRSFFS